MAPGRLQERWLQQAANARLRIVLADGDDARAVQAARRLATAGVAPTLVTRTGSNCGDDITQLDPRDPGDAITAVVTETVQQLARRHQLSASEQAGLASDALLVAVAAVRTGQVDGCVAGASRASADVARAGLRIVGLAPGHSTLSSAFIMVMPDGRAFAYGDCAVVPEPDAQQLADIAIATADTFQALVGQPPVVAMLSFSTKGSAEHASVDVIREAVDRVRIRRPELPIDGELQFDAALLPHVGDMKAPGSPAAGRANVFIFPNLAAANIAYKITERLAGAQAYGPLFQGLARPVNDLSRGCTAEDIYNISAITGVQALPVVQHSDEEGG
jgi:phosphotransacetylase